jgi:hypothetical protein
MIDVLQEDDRIRSEVAAASQDFKVQNERRLAKDRIPFPDSDFEAIQKVLTVKPLYLGVIDAADNWVVEVQKDAGRAPNDNEWGRLVDGPLDGMIGMSFALQWRYNFGRLFGSEF